MAQNVQIPRGLLVGLVITLLTSLLGLAFLLGRQSATPVALVSPTPHYQPPPLRAEGWSVPEETAADERLRPSSNPLRNPAPDPTYEGAEMARAMLARRRADRAEYARTVVRESTETDGDGATAPSAPEATSPAASSPPTQPSQRPVPRAATQASPQRTTSVAVKSNQRTSANNAEVRKYLSQIDGLAGAQGLGDPNQVAMELLQQSLQGDSSGMDSLLASTKNALTKLQAIQPPPSCREHHTLLVKQLRQGVTLLSGVGKATGGLDTSSLAKLSSQGKSMQAEAQRFAELDRQLRSQP